MSTNPLLTEFRAELMRYEEVKQQIEQLPNVISVGPLLLATDQIKTALVVETKAWKASFCWKQSNKFELLFSSYQVQSISKLCNQSRDFQVALCKCLNVQYRAKMEELHEFINEYSKRLLRPIKDLDDVREAMKALDMIKIEFTRIDFTIGKKTTSSFCKINIK